MDWNPPQDWTQLESVESHAGGEPLRVIVDGFPEVRGETMPEKRQYVREHYDDLRTALMWEPRGHADMYGVLPTEPVTDDGDVGVLFMHNDGYSTMCGHGVIALGVVLPEVGLVEVDPDRPRIKMDTPAGRVTAKPAVDDDGRIRNVSFENVPSYVVDLDRTIEIPQYSTVTYDLAYGGAYYAYCDVEQFGIAVEPDSAGELIRIGRTVKQAIAREVDVEHPTEPDLGFLYGAILTESGSDWADVRNACVFADGELDRSPTGTGVSGHLAIQHARAQIDTGERYSIESITDARFHGRIVEEVDFEGYGAVVPEVSGSAYVTGTFTSILDPDDPLRDGFFLR
jgi:trans-L-3-hydroxyproline dehydratase